MSKIGHIDLDMMMLFKTIHKVFKWRGVLQVCVKWFLDIFDNVFIRIKEV